MTLIAVGFAAVLGGLVQGILGFGASYVLVPVLALWRPELLPASVVIGVLPLNLAMALRARHATPWAGVARLTVSRLPGIGIGALVVAVVSPQMLATVVGITLLLAVASSAVTTSPPVTPHRQRMAGVVSGFTGTVAALAGPPIALLYRGADGERLRATLPAVWAIGAIPTLVALGAVGQLRLQHSLAGLVLSACLVLGLRLGMPLAGRIGRRSLRVPVLAWAGIGAFLALMRASI